MAPARRHVALVGPMGSGKSTIGRQVADHLGTAFIDNDVVLEQRVGADADSYAATHGREALHEVEATLLLEALHGAEPAVLATAASTIEDERCRRALAEHAVTVWLHGEIADLAARAEEGEHRPLGDDVAGELARLGRRRDPLYAEAADLAVDVTANTTPAAVAAILDHLELLDPRSPLRGRGGADRDR
jgi:shikimate kinase